MIGKVCNEEKVSDDVVITVESGIYGGVQAGGIDFGIGQNLMAMIGHHEQMDYYNGAGVDITYMGFGELGKTEASTPQRWEQDVLEPVDLLILHRMRRRSYSLEHLLQAVQNMNSKMVS